MSEYRGVEISKLARFIAKIHCMLDKTNFKWDIKYRPKDKYYVIRIGEKKC